MRCIRCDTLLRILRNISGADNATRALALVLAALTLFVVANCFPILTLQVEGRSTDATLFSSIEQLVGHNRYFIALLVFVTCVAAPLGQLIGMLYILVPLQSARIPRRAALVYRLIRFLGGWNLLEVLMLGILVSVVKLDAMAAVIPGVALWAYGGLILIGAWIGAALDNELLWENISGNAKPDGRPAFTTRMLYTDCGSCHYLCAISATNNARPVRCPRCESLVYYRKPDAQQRCLALLIAAGVLYIPANLLPVMSVTRFGSTESDTILSGVLYLVSSGSWPLGLVVFVASIVIPGMKLFILSVLLISVRMRLKYARRERTLLYRLIEMIGRWSMVDVYVVSLMSAVVQAPGLAEVETGPGAVAFGAVVVLTVLATQSFDPRLIWDAGNGRAD